MKGRWKGGRRRRMREEGRSGRWRKIDGEDRRGDRIRREKQDRTTKKTEERIEMGRWQ